MLPGNPGSARYVVEIRDAAGTSLLLTSADWTAKERNVALLAVLRLVGMKAAAPPKRSQRSNSAARKGAAEEVSGQRVGAVTPRAWQMGDALAS
jgi:hypothetical protein